MRFATVLTVVLLGIWCLPAQGHVFDGTLEETRTGCIEEFRRLNEPGAGKPDEEQTVFMHGLCRHPAVFDNLPWEAKHAVMAFDGMVAQQRAKVGREEAAQLDGVIAQMIGIMRSKDCPGQSSWDVDNEVGRLWSTLREALKSGDLNGAANCFHAAWREQYRDSLQQMDRERLRAMGAAMQDLVAGKIEGNTAAYQTIRVENGQRYSYEVRLHKDEECRWRILSF